MAKGSLIIPAVLLFTATLFSASLVTASAVSARQTKMANSGSWSGVIVNSTCSADEAFAESPECTKPGVPGAKLALYDDTIRQVYALESQEKVTAHLGDSVTVQGTLQDKTLQVASMEMLTSIGLAVGQKAPALEARDQFGHEQTLDTLKGQHGTVLLFFRSADW